MGCFSYMCKECGKPVNSDSFTGEECRIYRLENGQVMQEMRGQYNSYGSVFDGDGLGTEWKGDIHENVDKHFNSDNTTGFAIVHERCFSGKVPTTISDDDPDQGWGYYEGVDVANAIITDSWPEEYQERI